MEEPNLESVETTGETDEPDEEPDSAIGNSQSLKSDESASISLNVTSQVDSDATCDCSTFSSVSEQKVDLFDQLVSHFNKKSSVFSGFEDTGRTGRRPTRAGTFYANRRRTYSAQHTIARRRGRSFGSDYLTLPNFRRKQASDTISRRQTSTPDSSSINLEQSSSLTLGVSRIRASSTSSSDCPNNGEQSSLISSNSNLPNTESELNRTERSSCPSTRLTIGQKSQSFQSLRDIKLQRKSGSTIDMLRAQTRRSVTPDITTQRQARRTGWGNPCLDGLLSPSSSRGSLDRLTADSIDRRRVRRRTSDRFKETIEGVGQLAMPPPRSRSAMANISRDSDNWSASSFHESEVPSEPDLAPTYVDKNGNIKQNEDLSIPSLSSSRVWTPQPDVTINSVDSGNEEILQFTQKDTRTLSRSSDDVTSTNSLDVQVLHDLHSQSHSNAELEAALTEDHDSIMRLERIREDQFTMKLISAMKELKDIAEVARIIDEVDDEEWLLVFIGELDHRLRYLMKLEEEEDEGPEDHEANLRERATILDVALDLISFLKDRSAYRIHRRSTYFTDVNNVEQSGNGDIMDDGYGTIQRMRKLAATKPSDPYDMPKWQRQLSNLAGTLDKYINVLQKTKDAPPPQLPRRDVTTITSPGENRHAKRYLEALSDLSTVSSGESRHRSFDRQTSSGISVGSPEPPTKNEYKPNPNSNNNNNNSYNSNKNGRHPTVQSSQKVRTLPVLDLRETTTNDILDHIGRAARVKGGRDEVFSPTGIDRNRFVQTSPYGRAKTRSEPQTPQSAKNRSPRTEAISPGTVVSAYCILADQRRRSASLSNDRDKRKSKSPQKAEFQMSVETSNGCGTPENGSLGRRTQSLGQSQYHPQQNDRPPISTKYGSGVSISRPPTSNGPLGRRTRSMDTEQITESPLPHQRNLSSGARPKVRPPTQSSSRRYTNRSESSSGSDLEHPRLRHRPVVTSSMSTQCDLDEGLRLREKNAEEKLKQMKRKADLLKTGLDEARQERDEKERKIAVLQARLDRMKKNLVVGESEKGAVEEEMDRLNKLLKEKTIESAEEVAALQRRLEELERKLQKEREKYERMDETVENLQQQLLAAQRQCAQIAGGKQELEQQIHDLTLALMHERQHGAQLQEDNTRLEGELEEVNRRLERNAQENERERQRLQRLGSDLQKKLDEQRRLAASNTGDKATANEKVSQLENELGKAEHRIEGLRRENEKLTEEKQELVEALSHEQMMSKDLAKCYMEQVEYLNHEMKINEEMKKAQQEQYDREISRLLSEGAIQSGVNAEMLTKAKDDAEREKKRADDLEKENEQLRNERDEAKAAKSTKKSTGQSTEDKAVQADDMSYTRLRAFDWYSSEASRDARRLREQGQQLNQRGRQLEQETRERMRMARDAMRQVNYSLLRERSTAMPKVVQPTRYGYQPRR